MTIIRAYVHQLGTEFVACTDPTQIGTIAFPGNLALKSVVKALSAKGDSREAAFIGLAAVLGSWGFFYCKLVDQGSELFMPILPEDKVISV